MTSTEILVIVVGVLVGYWLVSRVLGTKRPRDGQAPADSDPDTPRG